MPDLEGTGQMKQLPSVKEILEKIKALQLEAHLEMEKIDIGKKYRPVKDRRKLALLAYWQTRFQLLTDLKYFVDPASAPTSTVMGSLPSQQDRVFIVEAEHVKVAEDWIRKHKCRHRGKKVRTAIGGQISYTFVNTSIGQLQNVHCACGESTCINGDDV